MFLAFEDDIEDDEDDDEEEEVDDREVEEPAGKSSFSKEWLPEKVCYVE